MFLKLKQLHQLLLTVQTGNGLEHQVQELILLSPDGTKQIKNFNEQNSPLFSNSIVSLAVDNKTGEVWFGTSKGIQSYRGDATEGEEKFYKCIYLSKSCQGRFYRKCYHYRTYEDSQIRITDISGNLVYETVSDGGQATWDLKTYNGKTCCNRSISGFLCKQRRIDNRV